MCNIQRRKYHFLNKRIKLTDINLICFQPCLDSKADDIYLMHFFFKFKAPVQIWLASLHNNHVIHDSLFWGRKTLQINFWYISYYVVTGEGQCTPSKCFRKRGKNENMGYLCCWQLKIHTHVGVIFSKKRYP